jgi:hypothetical protein
MAENNDTKVVERITIRVTPQMREILERISNKELRSVNSQLNVMLARDLAKTYGVKLSVEEVVPY